jgi:hypothetical protein
VPNVEVDVVDDIVELVVELVVVVPRQRTFRYIAAESPTA